MGILLEVDVGRSELGATVLAVSVSIWNCPFSADSDSWLSSLFTEVSLMLVVLIRILRCCFESLGNLVVIVGFV